QENETEARLKLFKAYAVDATAMAQAADDAIFLHCLPAYRGYEVSSDVIDGPQSRVFDEAENRLHAKKAVVAWLLYASNLAEIPESLTLPQPDTSRTEVYISSLRRPRQPVNMKSVLFLAWSRSVHRLSLPKPWSSAAFQ